jgi:hypothetical protein
MSHDIKRDNGEAATDAIESALRADEQSNIRNLLNGLLSEADRFDDNLVTVYDEQHINTATGERLAQFGELADVTRKSGESDSEFRARIKAEFAAGTALTTFDDYLEFAAVVLNTNVENITLDTRLDLNPAKLRVIAQEQVYTDSGISDTDIVEILGSGVPAGHEIEAIEEGTLRLKEDGETDTASQGLTSDSTSEGGTLSEDLV